MAEGDYGLKTDVLGKRRNTGIALAFRPSQLVIKQTLVVVVELLGHV